MILVSEFETLNDAITAFAAETKPILRDAQRRTHFSPDRAKQHKKARSAGGNNHRRKKPEQGKRRY